PTAATSPRISPLSLHDALPIWSCPQCAYLQTEHWLAHQQARLLACDHYHVIFTLPHDLNPLWLANVSAMTSLLFQAVRETLFDLDRKSTRLNSSHQIISYAVFC